MIARGTSSWQGHVFLIESILPDGWWQTIGGNQGSLGEVSRSIVDPSKSQVLAVRMPVVATVEALRTAGSTTIKGADTDEKLGIIGTVFVPIFEGIKSVTEHMLGLAEAPSFTSLPESLTWWGSVIEQASRVWKYAYDQPWMAAVLIVSVGMVVRAKITKRGRVAEHAAGVPIASEVAAQGST